MPFPRRLAAAGALVFAASILVTFSLSFFLASSLAAAVRTPGVTSWSPPAWSVTLLKLAQYGLPIGFGLVALRFGTWPRPRWALVGIAAGVVAGNVLLLWASKASWRPPAMWMLALPTTLLALWFLLANDPGRPFGGSRALAWVGTVAGVSLLTIALLDALRGVPHPLGREAALLRQAAVFVAVVAQSLWALRLVGVFQQEPRETELELASAT